ncbi:MAG: hypothetical protein GC161_15555 [Planctomycetaceae bacterium]|nr:hypothetical protein [Planctomycetaceae bacterium]
MRPRPARRAAVLAAALLVGSAALAAVQGPAQTARPGGGDEALEEGPLGNRSRLVVDDAAAARLFDGDRAFSRSRAADAAGQGDAAGQVNRAADLGAAFDAWQGALASSATGAAVPYAPVPALAPADPRTPPTTDPRRAEGVEAAVLRRLDALGPEGRRAWRTRWKSQGESRLAVALDALQTPGTDGTRGAEAAQMLARVERELPGTETALRAALVLADLCRADGRALGARTFLHRARRQAELLDGDAPAGWAEAVARRESMSRPGASRPEPWEPASAFAAVTAIPLLDPLAPGTAPKTGELGRGLRPGLAWLADGRAAIQGASRLWVLNAAATGIELTLEPAALLADNVGQPTLPYPPQGPPGWLLEPAARGRSVVLVEGRATPRGGAPNALLRVDLPEPLADLEAPSTVRSALPELVWALRGEDRAGRLGGPAEPPSPGLRAAGIAPEAGAALALADAEFQPGPLWTDERVLVQARRGEGEIDGLAVAVDPDSGAPLWARTLVQGAERAPDGNRFSAGGPAWGAPSPPVLGPGGRTVFVCTHLGAVGLLDALDGRVHYTLLHQRAAENEPTWSGARPVPTTDGFVAAPADSDFLYLLPAGPFTDAEPDAADALRARPEPRGEGLELVGAGGDRVLLLSRAGARLALSERDLSSGAGYEAVHFGRGEWPREGALVSTSRVAVASDRALWIFDRTRDLYLLAQVPLPEGPLAAPPAALPGSLAPNPRRVGGSVHGRGARLLVLELDRLLVLHASP